MITSKGQLLRTGLVGVNPKGAKAGGVAGMNVDGGEVIAAGIVYDGSEAVLATMSDQARVKLTPVSEYPVKGRGGKGVRAHKFLKGEEGLASAVIDTPASVKGVNGSGTLLALKGHEGKRDGSGLVLEGGTALAAVGPRA